MLRTAFLTIIALAPMLVSTIAIGDDAKRPAVTRDDYVVTDSTKIDFEGASIDGKMKAPTGFFLQGRNQQSLSEMVKLRSNFKPELKSSRNAVRAMVR